jgi:alpha-L-arabinofuranosidase
MEKLAAMKPAFLRLPGGNYLEGKTIDQRFEWKNTVGPIEQRPGHESPWGYRSDDGLGLLEFAEWCEEPVSSRVHGPVFDYSFAPFSATVLQIDSSDGH